MRIRLMSGAIDWILQPCARLYSIDEKQNTKVNRKMNVKENYWGVSCKPSSENTIQLMVVYEKLRNKPFF